jgi:predicted chitinase
MKHRWIQSQTARAVAAAVVAAGTLCGCGGSEGQSESAASQANAITSDTVATLSGDRAAALATAQASGPVCFFEHTEYRGASFCSEADSAWVGAPWNDRISSVRVPAGTQVDMFFDINYGGRALTIGSDTANLVSLNFNDFASSFRIRAGGGGGGGGCNAVTWTRGVNYGLGTVVLFPPNGQYYKVVNVGSNGSDATDPTISTWYWQPTACGGGGGFVVSEVLFNQMFPSRIAFYNYQGLVAALGAYPAFATSGNDTVKRQEAAAFLANIDHESGGLRYVREINTANWNSYCSSGNCGGRQYYGRGPTQLSWDYNYRAAGDALGIDLLGNPDLVATDSAIAWKTAIWFWMTQRSAAPRTPHDAMVQGAGFGETIRAINGGIECNASGLGNQQMRARVDKYLEFTRLLGVPAGNNLTC